MEKETISQYSLLYRPRKWEDVYGQDNVAKALRKRILTKDYPSAVLFQGPFGTGKTTLCEIFCAAMQASLPDGNPDWENPACKSILTGSFDRDTFRLDGSQLSGKTDVLDFTRNLNMKPLYSARKILIIEECDQISTAGMSSLLKVLEGLKPWVTVVLLSMEDKVSGAIKSRCQTYQIKPLDNKSIMMGLKHLMEQTGDWTNENIPNDFRLQGLNAIASASQGSMRNAVQYLEKCIVNEAWTVEAIEDLLEVVDEVATWKILDLLLEKSKDEDMWRKLIWLKTGDETMRLYNYMCMLLSEGLLYKETGVCAEKGNDWRMKKMASNPNLESLYYCLTLHPQMSKPFLRTSDLLGALTCYYQGLDFRPKTSQERAVEQLKNMTVAYIPETDKSTIADAFESSVKTTLCTAPISEALQNLPDNTVIKRRAGVNGDVSEVTAGYLKKRGRLEKTLESINVIEQTSTPNTKLGEQKIIIGTKESSSLLKPKVNESGIPIRTPKVDISNLNIAF